MPVNTKRQEFLDFLPRWQRCRDVTAGATAVKAKGVTYLPKPEGKQEKDYPAYLARAEFYGATGRTVNGLLGAMFRKEPVIESSVKTPELLLDVTGDGVPFGAFCKIVAMEILQCGRVGVLVDLPKEPTPTPKPRFVRYIAEQIINWRAAFADGGLILEQVIIEEVIEEPAVDFGVTLVDQWRELVLIDGIYNMRLWRNRKESNEDSEFYIAEQAIPNKAGKPLTFIPFWFIGSDRLSPDPAPIPIEDLVELNLSHYLKSADYNTGLYYAGNPVVWLAGFPNSTELSIGSGMAWVTDNTEAKAGYLEFTGQGLQPIRDAMSDSEKRMAAIGGRLLEEQKADAESAVTVMLRNSGENSVLKTIALTMSQGLTDSLTVFTEWAGIEGESKVTINTDFFAIKLSAPEITALVSSWQKGAFSHDTLLYNLKKFEVLPDGVTPEQERQLIEIQKPKIEEPADPGQDFE